MVSREEFKNPPVAYRIKPFWFWNGDITREEITYQIEEMKDKGLGGAFICARQGQTVPYLSKEWFDLVAYAGQEARRCGLETWLYDEYPYPSGMSGGEVLLEHPEAEHKVLRHKTLWIKGGASVEEELDWGKILLAQAYPVVGNETDWDHGFSLLDRIGILQTNKIYQQTGLTKYNRKRFFSYGPKKVLRAILPEGDWRIELYWETAMGDFKYYGGFMDPCNAEAVKTFLDTTHERYKTAIGDQFGKSVFGMFSDEVGLLSPIPWSSLLPKAFEKRNGYSLLEVLPALHDDTVNGAMRIRYDLYQTAHELFVDSYHKQVSSWCQENHLSYATEVPSMRMSTQRYSDIVGGDTAHEKLGRSLEWIYDEYLRHYRSNAKAVSSLARQLDKSYAMIESFHSLGWSMTLQDAKWMIDRLGSSGINFYNFHAFYYTIQDITKHDAPPSQFIQNPYWKHYRKLADYVGRMGVMISNTEADIEVAVLDPVAALWTKLGNPFHGFPYKGESEEERKICDHLRNQWVRVCKTILFHQMDYDHLDSELLAEAVIRDGKIYLGRAAYSVVVMPPCHCMEDAARRKLEEFVLSGGLIIGLEMLPYQSIDEKSDQETTEAWEQLYHKEKAFFLPGNDWEEELISLIRHHIHESAVAEVTEGNPKDVIVSVRLDEEKVPYVFVANQGKEHVVARIIGDIPDANCYDLETGDITSVEGSSRELKISLGAYESKWIKLSRERENETHPVTHSETHQTFQAVIPMQDMWNVQLDGGNICRFSNLEMSLDGISWSATEAKTFVEQCGETGILGGQQINFRGDFGLPKEIQPAYPLVCQYRMEFDAELIPPQISLLMDQDTIAGAHEIYINKIPVAQGTYHSIRHHDQNNLAAPVEKLIHIGRNLIEIKVVIEKPEDGLRDPIYLMGEFGVDSVTRDGKVMPCLTLQPRMTSPDASWYHGFPYYSGQFTFTRIMSKQSLVMDEKPFLLALDFHTPVYDCIEVLVNGHSLGVKAYTPYLWECCPAWLKEENEITVKITNTLANLLDGTYFDYDAHKIMEIKL